ncbi:MAG: chromosome segregation protein SMC [Pseudomonadota bacterium]
MHFTRLRLQGFKSFVDPTEMSISPGLTGLVGPNGCGKSNLVEALRWVMGESRARAMRGGDMDDVIFAGAASRPARNQASVALMIDNGARLAPAVFNDSDRLEVNRRITRDVGSAYTLNGKSARARDVQMLFADASTGAASPALVRQGQVAELINAKPKARRRVLEEAAGISGLYQRRHEAELKLNAAEANLARIEEVLQGFEAQLKALEKQAAQARRYREIAADLRDAEARILWLRHLQVRAAAAEAQAAKDAAVRAEGLATRVSSEAERLRARADEAMPPLREEETIAAALLQRLTIERGQIEAETARAEAARRALAAQLVQLSDDRAREEALAHDAAETIARLEAEESGFAAEDPGTPARMSAAEDMVKTAGALLDASEAKLSALNETAAALAAQATALTRQRDEAAERLERLATEIAAGEADLAEIEGQIAGFETALGQASEGKAAAAEAVGAAELALTSAEAEAATARSGTEGARAAAIEAQSAAATLQAEKTGLERLLAQEDRGGAAAALDKVSVSPGYETAIGAALGDELAAPLLSDREAGGGWRYLPAIDAPAALPDGSAPLAGDVDAPPELSRSLSQIGLVAPEDGPDLQAALAPGQSLVSREGDLWRWDGYVSRGGEAGSAAALRLERQNRLTALTQQLEEAVSAYEGAAAAQSQAEAAAKAAAEAEAAARTALRDAEGRLAAASRAQGDSEAQVTRSHGRRDVLDLARASRTEEHRAAESTLTEAEAQIAALDDLGDAQAAVVAERAVVDGRRAEMLAAKTTLADLRREIEARAERRRAVAADLGHWRKRGVAATARIEDLSKRIAATELKTEEAQRRPAQEAEKAGRLAQEIAATETRLAAARDALALGETVLREALAEARDADKAAAERRADRARCDAMAESSAAAVAEAEARIRETLETDVAALAERFAPDAEKPMPLDRAEAEIARLRRQRDAIGPVNLRAEEDAAGVTEERDKLAEEKAELDTAIAKLRGGIGTLNAEGRQRLRKAFEEVNSRFTVLFRHLFGGGEAQLLMVDSEDPLEAGLEILCQPPGKKLSTLSLLSGGEQTLTALSLIFAVFLCRPAPICVLDEVDAPLDDANVTRFCDLLDEMIRRTDTRFLIITHHAITMGRMDRLYGVTMVEAGVSQLVSVDLAAAAAMVDA